MGRGSTSRSVSGTGGRQRQVPIFGLETCWLFSLPASAARLALAPSCTEPFVGACLSMWIHLFRRSGTTCHGPWPAGLQLLRGLPEGSPDRMAWLAALAPRWLQHLLGRTAELRAEGLIRAGSETAKLWCCLKSSHRWRGASSRPASRRCAVPTWLPARISPSPTPGLEAALRQHGVCQPGGRWWEATLPRRRYSGRRQAW